MDGQMVLQQIFGHGKSPHATKRGPGRRHFQGKSERRFPVAVHGGNWQGQPYISYRELDRVYQLMQQRFLTRPKATTAMLSERKAQA